MILDFHEWSLNELEKTKHFKERELERVIRLEKALLPEGIAKEIQEKYSIDSLEDKIKNILIDEMVSRIDVLEIIKRVKFDSTAYPLISPIFNYNGNKYPINMVMKSIEKNGSIKNLIGNQVYVTILDQKMITLIPYSYDDTEEEIALRQRNHLARMGKKTEGFELLGRSSNYIYPLQIVDGKLQGGDQEKDRRFTGVRKGAPQQHELKKGGLIGVYLPFLKKIKAGSIESIINRTTYDKDGAIHVVVKLKLFPNEIPPGGQPEIKIIKKLVPGEKIELPVGDKGQFVECEVVPPGYVQDKRVSNPILKYSKIIR